jgi:hypothetical protein
MKRLLLMCAGLLSGFAVAIASDPTVHLEKTQLPSGPILGKMADFSAWQVTYSYQDDNTPAAGKSGKTFLQPRRVTVVRTRPLWHAVTVDIEGKTTEQWSAGKGQFLLLPGEPAPIAGTENAAPGMDAFSFLTNYEQVDFQDMQWISANNYVGTQAIGSTTCFVFQQNNTRVWLDANTRYPVRWQQGGEVRQFQFLKAPTERLSLPPAIAEIQRRVDHAIQAGNQTAPKGG